MSMLSIGNVVFETRRLAAPMHVESDESYRRFFVDDAPNGAERISVDVRVEEPTTPVGLEPRFDSGRSWSLGYDRANTRFHLRLIHARNIRRAICVAEFGDALDHVTLTCAPEMLVDGMLPNLLRYPLDQLLLMFKLAQSGGLIVHATTIMQGDRAIVLAGRSGAGKTTIARMIESDPTLCLLSDDRAILRVSPDGPRVYGTPWPGEGGHAQNHSAKLVGLGFLTKAYTTAAIPIAPRAAIERLMPVASIPWFDGAHVESCLATSETLVRGLPIFDFQFSLASANEVHDAIRSCLHPSASFAGAPPLPPPRSDQGDRREHGALP